MRKLEKVHTCMKDFRKGAATPRLELSSKFIFWESSPFAREFQELLEEISLEDGANVFFVPLEDNAGALDLSRCQIIWKNWIIKEKNGLGGKNRGIVWNDISEQVSQQKYNK